MKKKDFDYIARLEKAVKEKYGEDAIQNPAKFWDKDKEKETTSDFDNVDGILISRKLINKEAILNCPVCEVRLKTINDDIYTIKHKCCEKCYIQYIEGREDRWLQGWRPKNVRKNT